VAKRLITAWRPVVEPWPSRARQRWLALRLAKRGPGAAAPADPSSDRWDSEGGRVAAR
jgi:hypothetical protein